MSRNKNTCIVCQRVCRFSLELTNVRLHEITCPQASQRCCGNHLRHFPVMRGKNWESIFTPRNFPETRLFRNTQGASTTLLGTTRQMFFNQKIASNFFQLYATRIFTSFAKHLCILVAWPGFTTHYYSTTLRPDHGFCPMMGKTRNTNLLRTLGPWMGLRKKPKTREAPLWKCAPQRKNVWPMSFFSHFVFYCKKSVRIEQSLPHHEFRACSKVDKSDLIIDDEMG